MTAEQYVYATLSAVGDCYIEHLPVNAPLPAVVYQRAGGKWHGTNCDNSLQPEIRLCVFANTPAERAEWVAQIRAIADVNLWQPEDILIFEYDYATKSYCAIWSYLIDFFEQGNHYEQN